MAHHRNTLGCTNSTPVETGLYYLKTRYYDAETSRFINADDIAYLDPESINGLNLYAYCLNNPVMMTDETGNMPNWLKWLIGGISFVGAVALTIVSGGALSPVIIGMGVSILAGGLIQGGINAANGGSFGQGFADGMADGVLWGGIFALGGAAIRGIKYASAVKTQNHSALAKLFTHNKHSSKVMLGKWDGGGATSYIAKAGRSHTYFSMPQRIYTKLADKGIDMWSINEAFLSQNLHKTFYASHSVIGAIGIFADEIAFLLKKGIRLII